MLMRSLWKKLLIILFLNSIFLINIIYRKNITNLLILINHHHLNMKLNFKSYQFRNLSFELISCKTIEFDKYFDTAALLKITQMINIYRLVL